MLMSMTGFGRGSAEGPFGTLVAEIQSVNRRYLEIYVNLPKEFQRFENEVRKWVGDTMGRGQVSVRIHLAPSPKNAQAFLPDVEMLRNLKFGWEKVAQQLQLDPKKIDLAFLLQSMPQGQKVDFAEDGDLLFLHKAVDEALQGLLAMKRKEGSALAEDVLHRLTEMEKMSGSIASLSPESVARMRQKLVERMREVLQPGVELDERLLRETALYAEKVDISEELARLKSHFAQFHQLLKGKEGSLGRKMDFYVQEMGREINTIGSKSSDANIAHLVVEMKSELEKAREQIQNIE